MKKILLGLMFINSILLANINAIVSIVPQQTFLEAIGGDKVDVTVMVKPGNSPHTYEPKPSQMIAISNADVYFSMGVEFEEVWLPKFQNQNKNMKIVNSIEGITKIEMEEHHHGDEEEEKHDGKEHHEEEGDHDEKDPHVWVSPKLVKVIAQNMYNKLVEIDRENRDYYKKNLDNFLLHVADTDKQIRSILNGKHMNFIVFHPSWGYFAKDYGLTQVAIEVEGKDPKPKDLQHLIEEAKEEKASAIFTSPEFSDAIAKQLAHELKIPVIKVSALAKNWSSNLISFTKYIAGK